MHNEYTGYPTIMQLAADGLRLFPVHSVRDGLCSCGNAECDSPGKHPRTSNGFKAATNDEVMLRGWLAKWPDANWGLATGAGSGIFVLDVDGAKGRESLIGRELPDGPIVGTGRDDGGQHHYFRNRPGLRNRAAMAPGLDTRGEGGYVLIPPSVHKTGALYEWLSPFTRDALPDTPEWLYEEAKTKAARGYNLSALNPGSRNMDLASFAGKMRHDGASPAAIANTVHFINDEQSDPLPDAEVDAIAASIGKYAPQASLILKYRHTEDAYAERMAIVHGGEIRYQALVNRWIEWDGKRWATDESKNAQMQGRAKAMLDATYAAAGTITGDDHTEKQKKFRREVQGKESKRAIDAIIDLTRSEPGIMIRPDELDSDPMLFNVANGTIDLRTDRLLPHDPKGLITKISPVTFDPEATCPKWDTFILEVFDGNADLIAYVRRALGYLLTGDTSEQDFWIAWGGGANGKSTLLNTVLKVLGDYGTTTAFTTFDAENRNQYGNDIAALKGRRFVFASEAERERNLAEARVKAVTGGDAISCKYLYGEYFTFTPQFKVWLAVNHKPNIRGTDRGIWRRLKLIPFARNFEDVLVTKLPETLAGELPGILNWMLAGLAEWRDIGMDEPDCVKVATEDYRLESDQLGQWIEQKCEIGPDHSASATNLYSSYKAWLTENNDDKYPLGTKSFGVQLSERRGVTRVKGTAGEDKGKMIYHGLRPAAGQTRGKGLT